VPWSRVVPAAPPARCWSPPAGLPAAGPAGELDATRFEELTAQARRALARGAADAAGSLLRQALGLWRGEAFGEFLGNDVGAAESDRLAELCLVRSTFRPRIRGSRLMILGALGLFCGRLACDRGSLRPTRQGIPIAEDA
jgi:hypothetical protein